VARGDCVAVGPPEMADAVDVLFVDEAGQMSLANVLASLAGKQRVLSYLVILSSSINRNAGVHPPGAEASALSHLLNARQLSARSRDYSWRKAGDSIRMSARSLPNSSTTTGLCLVLRTRHNVSTRRIA